MRASVAAAALPDALAIEIPERPARRRRHVAILGPARPYRQLVDQPVAPAHRLQHAHGHPGRQRVERRPLRHPCPCPEGGALGPRAQTTLERLFAQLALQVRQRNAHRTDNPALVAHRRRRRQVLRILETDVHRRQDRADRAGIHPPVRMAADILIHRAVVHARAAADAAQRLADLAAENGRAAAVDQDEIHVLGAVELAFAFRPGQDVDVVGDRLAGRRARQKAHERRDVLQRRHDLLDARDRDVHFRQRRRQRRIALVGDQHHGSGFGDEEIAARDAHVGRQVVLPQHAARLEAELLDAGLARGAVFFVEEIGDLVLRLVQRGTDDVRRRLVVVDLQDVFAEVGLDDGEPGRLDRVIERRLLADHRFRLDDLAHVVACGDLEHQRVDLGGGLRPQDGGAARGGVLLEHLQPDVEIVERAIADRLAGVARAFEVVELDQRRPPLRYELALHPLQVVLEKRVVQLDVRALLEVH